MQRAAPRNVPKLKKKSEEEVKRCGVCHESLGASAAANFSAKTNAKIPRNSQRQTERCLPRAGARKMCCKKCWKTRVSVSSWLELLVSLAPPCVFVLHTNTPRWFRRLWRLGRGCGSHLGVCAQVRRVHFLQCAHRGDGSRRRGRAFAPPTWVSGRTQAPRRGEEARGHKRQI